MFYLDKSFIKVRHKGKLHEVHVFTAEAFGLRNLDAVDAELAKRIATSEMALITVYNLFNKLNDERRRRIAAKRSRPASPRRQRTSSGGGSK